MTDNGGGFGEGSGIFFAFLIFALFAFGGGAWGFGRNGLTGAGAVIADNGIQSQLDNIQAQNFYNSLNNGIAGIQSALCQGFAGINQTVNNTAAAAALQNSNQTRDILAAITAGNAALANKIDQNTISALQTENARLYADKSNLIQSIGFGERFCGLEKQLAACCCSTQNDLNLILSKLPATGTTGA
jgi:hypothetical protein